MELGGCKMFQYDNAPVHKASTVKTWFAKVTV